MQLCIPTFYPLIYKPECTNDFIRNLIYSHSPIFVVKGVLKEFIGSDYIQDENQIRLLNNVEDMTLN